MLRRFLLSITLLFSGFCCAALVVAQQSETEKPQLLPEVEEVVPVLPSKNESKHQVAVVSSQPNPTGSTAAQPEPIRISNGTRYPTTNTVRAVFPLLVSKKNNQVVQTAGEQPVDSSETKSVVVRAAPVVKPSPEPVRVPSVRAVPTPDQGRYGQSPEMQQQPVNSASPANTKPVQVAQQSQTASEPRRMATSSSSGVVRRSSHRPSLQERLSSLRKFVTGDSDQPEQRAVRQSPRTVSNATSNATQRSTANRSSQPATRPTVNSANGSIASQPNPESPVPYPAPRLDPRAERTATSPEASVVRADENRERVSSRRSSADSSAEKGIVESDSEAFRPRSRKQLGGNVITPRVARAEKNRPDASSLPKRLDLEPASEKEDVLMLLSGPQLAARATGPKRIVVGRAAEFTVVLQNSGDVEANGVVVNINLPSWVDIAETTPSQGVTSMAEKTEIAQPLQWRINRLDASSKEELKLSIIPRESQPLSLGVHWTYAHSGSHAQVEVEQPLLHMDISGPREAIYGETKTYNMTISNPGTGDAENVRVHLLPLNGKQEGAPSQLIGTLKKGESKTIQIELSAGKAGTLLVKAKATAEGGLEAEAMKQVLVRRAELSIEVNGPKAQYAGNTATYQFRIANPGNATAEDVVVSAVLPAGALFLSGSDQPKLAKEQGKVSWNIGLLPSGQEKTMKVVCQMNSPGANQIRVTAHDETDLTTVAEATTEVLGRANLKLVVSDPQVPVLVGDEAVYEVRIRNRGTKAAENVEAVVFFSEGIEPSSVRGGGHEISRGQVVFKPIESIAAGSEVVIQIRAIAQQPGNHIFRTEVLCRSLGAKLAAEETTHFYDEGISQPRDRSSRKSSNEVTPASEREPAPLDLSAPKDDLLPTE